MHRARGGGACARPALTIPHSTGHVVVSRTAVPDTAAVHAFSTFCPTSGPGARSAAAMRNTQQFMPTSGVLPCSSGFMQPSASNQEVVVRSLITHRMLASTGTVLAPSSSRAARVAAKRFWMPGRVNTMIKGSRLGWPEPTTRLLCWHPRTALSAHCSLEFLWRSSVYHYTNHWALHRTVAIDGNKGHDPRPCSYDRDQCPCAKMMPSWAPHLRQPRGALLVSMCAVQQRERAGPTEL